MAIDFGATVFFNQVNEFTRVAEIARQYPVLNYVEFRGEFPFFFPDICSEKDLTFFREILQQAGLRCTLHTTEYDINLASLNSDLRSAAVESYRKYIDLAAQVGAEVVVVHGGVLYQEYTKTPDAEENILLAGHWLRQSLLALSDYAAGKKLVIGLENSPPKSDYALVYDAESQIEVLKSVSRPNVKALLDVAHAFLRGLDLENYLNRIKPYLCEIHAHNNWGENDDHLGLHHGKINFNSLLQHPAFNKVPVIMEIKSFQEAVATFEWLMQNGFNG